MKPVSILVVENMEIVRRGLMSLPQTHPEVIGSLSAHEGLDDVVMTGPAPDVVLLDLWLGRTEQDASLPGVQALRAWGAQVVLYTSEQRPYPLQCALAAGVRAIVPKLDPIDRLVEVIVQVAAGEPHLSAPAAAAVREEPQCLARLTPSELRVLRLTAYGLTAADIAETLVVSQRTVDTHMANILEKYSDATRTKVKRGGLLRLAGEDGYTDQRLEPKNGTNADAG